MKLVRDVIFWCHLVVAVCAGLIVVVMSATGVLLTYQKQVTSWADRRAVDARPPAPGVTRLPIEQLLERLNASGQLYLSHTKLGGKHVLRLCVGQTNVERRHVAMAWERIQEQAAK